MEEGDLVELIGPEVKALANATGTPASFTVAEAALKSGWRSSRLARQGKNLFGVRAEQSWHGDPELAKLLPKRSLR